MAAAAGGRAGSTRCRHPETSRQQGVVHDRGPAEGHRLAQTAARRTAARLSATAGRHTAATDTGRRHPMTVAIARAPLATRRQRTAVAGSGRRTRPTVTASVAATAREGAVARSRRIAATMAAVALSAGKVRSGGVFGAVKV